MKNKRPGRKKIAAKDKRRNFIFTVSSDVEKFLRGLEDRNDWLEKLVEKLVGKEAQ